VMGQQAVHILAHPEKVALLPDLFHRTVAVGAVPVHQLPLGPEGFAGGAVPPLVLAEIDVSLIHQALEDLLGHPLVPLLGRPDEVVVGDVQAIPELADARHDFIDELLGRLARFLGLALDLLAVLVGSGQIHHPISLEPLVAGHRIAGHRGIRVADVQFGAVIVDRRRDVNGFSFFRHRALPPFRISKNPPPKLGARGSPHAVPPNFGIPSRRMPSTSAAHCSVNAGGRPPLPTGDGFRARSQGPCSSRRPCRLSPDPALCRWPADDYSSPSSTGSYFPGKPVTVVSTL